MAETKPLTAPEPMSEIQPHEPAMESTDEKIVRQRLGDFFLYFRLSDAADDTPFGYVDAELIKVHAPLPRPAAVTYDGSKQPERELLLPSEHEAAATFAARCEAERDRDKVGDREARAKKNPYAPQAPTAEQQAELDKNKTTAEGEDSQRETSSQRIAPGTEQAAHVPARNVVKEPPAGQNPDADRLRKLREGKQ
jgi:hypothetical protein